MRIRAFVIYINLIGLFLGIAATTYLQTDLWLHMEWWEVALNIYPLISAFGGLLLAYWLLMDEMEIESLREELEELKEK